VKFGGLFVILQWIIFNAMDKSKYIGKHVIAGSGFKSIRGKIVDVKDEYDDIFGDCTWFYIKDEDSSLIDRYAKEEICEIVPQIQETYIELE
jgi:hypothetical protein